MFQVLNTHMCFLCIAYARKLSAKLAKNTSSVKSSFHILTCSDALSQLQLHQLLLSQKSRKYVLEYTMAFKRLGLSQTNKIPKWKSSPTNHPTLKSELYTSESFRWTSLLRYCMEGERHLWKHRGKPKQLLQMLKFKESQFWWFLL